MDEVGAPARDERISQARRMVALARPDPSAPIVVLGPGALALTVELRREGRQEVVCGRRFGLPCALGRSSYDLSREVLVRQHITRAPALPFEQRAAA